MPKSAIMQPYVFPYLGYFHLIDASDVFLFYDDVHFIIAGWIHRNRVLDHKGVYRFAIPISGASPNRLIKDVAPSLDNKWRKKFYKHLVQNYSKAPYFDGAYHVVTSVLDRDYECISDLAIQSILSVQGYLGLSFQHAKSSERSPGTRGMPAADRLIEISNELGCSTYINAPGGKHLYEKEYFAKHGIELLFVNSGPVEYDQKRPEFMPWLSIIDVLMFNDPARVKQFLAAYTLE